MYVGWFFDSNQNKDTVIADYEFNPSLSQKQSPFYRQMYQEHERKKKFGELDCRKSQWQKTNTK